MTPISDTTASWISSNTFSSCLLDFVSGEFSSACQPLPGRKSREKTLNLKLGKPLSSGEHSFSVCAFSSPHVICHLCGILFPSSLLSNFNFFCRQWRTFLENRFWVDGDLWSAQPTLHPHWHSKMFKCHSKKSPGNVEHNLSAICHIG